MQDFQCPRCGRPKKIVFSPRPLLLGLTGMILLLDAIVYTQLPESSLRHNLTALGVALASFPAIASIHVKCMTCQASRRL